jgi:hypothetical protein
MRGELSQTPERNRSVGFNQSAFDLDRGSLYLAARAPDIGRPQAADAQADTCPGEHFLSGTLESRTTQREARKRAKE